jgi:hypothetical protein
MNAKRFGTWMIMKCWNIKNHWNYNNLIMEIKQMIIENFIDWYTSNDEERTRMKDALQSYLDEDHVDELNLQDKVTGMFINQITK